jgi:hypothetical protein
MSQLPDRKNELATRIEKSIGQFLPGFLAYLALTPMIFSWGLLLIILYVITLVSFEQTADAVDAIFSLLTDLTARFPFLERFAPTSPAVSESGIIEINNSNLREVIFDLYGYVAVLFVMLGLLLELVRGPRPPRSLKQKIKMVSLATLAVIAVFITNILFGGETWQGNITAWVLMFTIGPGIVLIVSIVSLTFQHFFSTMNTKENN